MTVNALTAERDELSVRFNDLNRRRQDAEDEVSIAYMEKTALPERIKTLEMKNRGLRAEMKSLQGMVEDASNIRSDQNGRKASVCY